MTTYTDLAVDSNGYLIVENGDLKKVRDFDEIVQHIIQRLQTYKGEFVLNKDVGVPYAEKVFVDNPNLDSINTILKREVVMTPGVSELTYFNTYVETATRKLRVKFSVKGMLEPVTTEINI